MSIRPETEALLDRFLGTEAERRVDDLLEQVRDLLCDLAWAADARTLKSGEGQAALDRFDSLADEIWEQVQ